MADGIPFVNTGAAIVTFRVLSYDKCGLLKTIDRRLR